MKNLKASFDTGPNLKENRGMEKGILEGEWHPKMRLNLVCLLKDWTTDQKSILGLKRDIPWSFVHMGTCGFRDSESQWLMLNLSTKSFPLSRLTQYYHTLSASGCRFEAWLKSPTTLFESSFTSGKINCKKQSRKMQCSDINGFLQLYLSGEEILSGSGQIKCWVHLRCT